MEQKKKTTGLLEEPCIYLQKFPFIKGEATIPAVKPQRARVVCLCNDATDCPKKKNRMDITMLCFRIRGHSYRRKKAAIANGGT